MALKVSRRALVNEQIVLLRLRRTNCSNKELCAAITARLTAIRDELRRLNAEQKARQLNRNMEALCRRTACTEGKVPAALTAELQITPNDGNEEGEKS